jgi:hypothetical protein
MFESLPPYWPVAAVDKHPKSVTPQVGTHLPAILSQIPAPVWVGFGVAAGLLVVVVALVAACSPNPDQRGDAIEVFGLVIELFTLACRVIRPSAFPGREDRPARPSRTRRRRRASARQRLHS